MVTVIFVLISGVFFLTMYVAYKTFVPDILEFMGKGKKKANIINYLDYAYSRSYVENLGKSTVFDKISQVNCLMIRYTPTVFIIMWNPCN